MTGSTAIETIRGGAMDGADALDKDAPDVDPDEAVFMSGACASFAAWLVNKHRKAARRLDGGR